MNSILQIQIRKLSNHLAELDLQISGDPPNRSRIVGPRCPGRTTIEIAYPIHWRNSNQGIIQIPEPCLWSESAPFCYQLILEWDDGRVIRELIELK